MSEALWWILEIGSEIVMMAAFVALMLWLSTKKGKHEKHEE